MACGRARARAPADRKARPGVSLPRASAAFSHHNPAATLASVRCWAVKGKNATRASDVLLAAIDRCQGPLRKLLGDGFRPIIQRSASERAQVPDECVYVSKPWNRRNVRLVGAGGISPRLPRRRNLGGQIGRPLLGVHGP
jgi:hypothetical protein